jgi:acetolactate synthase-1/3 small subunit
MKYTLTVFTENKAGVLNRISDLLVRRKINVDTLTVSTTEREGISRFTIVVDVNANQVEKVVKQIYKVIEVIKVYESTDQDLVFKEIAFYKITCTDGTRRSELQSLTTVLKAEIIHVEANNLVIQKTGSEQEIDHAFKLLFPFGIQEFIRSGRIAVRKN